MCSSHGRKLTFQPFTAFSRAHGFGEREVVTLDRWDSDISLQALEGKGLSAPAVSQSFSLPVKCKPKAVLAELRTLQSDSSALRSSVGTVLLP